MLQMGTASGEEKKYPTRIQRVIIPGSGSPSVISVGTISNLKSTCRPLPASIHCRNSSRT